MTGQRLSGSSVVRLSETLLERELLLVAQVAELGLMSGRQIEAVHFPSGTEASARHCRRVLGQLVAERILVRLERRVGGVRAGSASFVYALGPVGHRLLDDSGARPRRYEPSARFVDHQLAVSQLAVDLTRAARAGGLRLVMVEGEPACWRSLPTTGRALLRPDLFLAIAARGLEYRWFVEVDRGTHHPPAVARKGRLYESYYRSGVEQTAHGVFPRVIWITPDRRRADRLRELLSSGEFSEGLMVVAPIDQAVAVLSGGEA